MEDIFKIVHWGTRHICAFSVRSHEMALRVFRTIQYPAYWLAGGGSSGEDEHGNNIVLAIEAIHRMGKHASLFTEREFLSSAIPETFWSPCVIKDGSIF